MSHVSMLSVQTPQIVQTLKGTTPKCMRRSAFAGFPNCATWCSWLLLCHIATVLEESCHHARMGGARIAHFCFYVLRHNGGEGDLARPSPGKLHCFAASLIARLQQNTHIAVQMLTDILQRCDFI